MSKLIFITISVFTILSASVYGFFVWIGFESQFYDADELYPICRTMNLETTDFCTLQERMTHEDFEQSLATAYPLEETTYSDFTHSIDEIAYYNYGTCSQINPNERNLCPEPSNCTVDYSCYIISDIHKINFGINSEGHLQWFSVPPNGS